MSAERIKLIDRAIVVLTDRLAMNDVERRQWAEWVDEQLCRFEDERVTDAEAEFLTHWDESSDEIIERLFAVFRGVPQSSEERPDE